MRHPATRWSIIDGAANSDFPSDVAIQGGRIAAMGRLVASDAHVEVDVAGLIVAPGFIDIHSHSDDHTLESLALFVGQFPELEVIELWETADARPDHASERWTNGLLRRGVR